MKGKLYSVGIDPELFAAGGKLVGFFIRKGIYALIKCFLKYRYTWG